MPVFEKALITMADINRYRPIAEMDSKRLEPFILETQRMELRQCLGEALYYDFMLKVEDAVGFPTQYAAYQKLLRGVIWTYDGYTRNFDGLVPMLCYYTLARFIPNNPVNITKFGNTFKKNEFSEPLDAQATKNIVVEMRSVAISYQNYVTEYIINNQNDFPMYDLGRKENLNTTSVKFFDI